MEGYNDDHDGVFVTIAVIQELNTYSMTGTVSFTYFLKNNSFNFLFMCSGVRVSDSLELELQL